MKKLIKKHEPVEITWVDINADDSAWLPESDLQKHDVAQCKDVCYIYSQSNHKIITYSSYSYNVDGTIEFGGVCAFPKFCVKKIRKLS
jgi:hypothetical protein